MPWPPNLMKQTTCPLLIHEPQGGLQPFWTLKTEILSNGNERLQATPSGNQFEGKPFTSNIVSVYLILFFGSSSSSGSLTMSLNSFLQTLNFL